MGRGRLGDPGPDPNGDGGARNPAAQLSVGPTRVLSFGIGELPAAAADRGEMRIGTVRALAARAHAAAREVGNPAAVAAARAAGQAASVAHMAAHARGGLAEGRRAGRT